MIPDVSQTGEAVEQQWVPQPKAPVVMLNNVGKTYGRYQALGGVSLALSGGVTGILGLNGAGKSTLFKLLMGKLRATQGEVRLFGTNPWKNPAPYARVGYVPENESLHDWMSAFDFVTTFARLHGLTRDEAKLEAERVLEFVGLTDVMHKKIGRYSKGMRQRAKIAHALVNDPDLIILDEPLQGCDPLARTTIMNVIRELGRMGRTVLLSSHILSEIERITEQIVILHQGRLLAIGNVHAIREQLDNIPHTIELECTDAKALARDVLNLDSVHGLQFPTHTKLRIFTHHLGEFHKHLPKIVVENNHSISNINNPDDDLQTILGYLTGGVR